MESHITLSTGANVGVLGNENNKIVVDPAELGQTFVDRCEATNYVPLEDYSKFGTLKLGKAIHWKQGDFYKAMQNVADEESRLCKVGRRRIPCIALEQSSDFKEGEQVRFYQKGSKGHWGFRYDTLKELMQKNGDEIATFVDSLEADRAEQAELKAIKKELAKDRKCTLGELEAIILRELLEAKNV